MYVWINSKSSSNFNHFQYVIYSLSNSLLTFKAKRNSLPQAFSLSEIPIRKYILSSIFRRIYLLSFILYSKSSFSGTDTSSSIFSDILSSILSSSISYYIFWTFSLAPLSDISSSWRWSSLFLRKKVMIPLS